MKIKEVVEMRKIGICDDNEAVTKMLTSICRSYYNDTRICIDIFHSGEEMLRSSRHYDILFLDIELGNMNGIETAKEIRKTDIDVFIVIVSGYDAYKSLAFPIHAFDFIDKPVDEDKICRVLDEIELYYNKKSHVHYLSFKIKDGYIKLSCDDILYFYYFDRKVKIVTKNQEFEYYANMSELAEKMSKYQFYMIHRAYIVNMSHIKQINKLEVVMVNNELLPISRYKCKEFKDAYTKYISEFYDNDEERFE